MQTHQANSLIIDKDVYPRREVDGDHVFNLVEALRTGATFPPPIVCKVSKRIVDGAHRVTAIQRFNGSDTDIDCIEKTYKSDADLFLDAVKYNAANGRHLSRDDRERIAEIGDKLEVDESMLAKSLQISESVLGGLRAAREGSDERGQNTVRRTLSSRQREQEGRSSSKSARAKLRQPLTLSHEPDDYRAINRATEIIKRIDWNEAPDALVEAAQELFVECQSRFGNTR